MILSWHPLQKSQKDPLEGSSWMWDWSCCSSLCSCFFVLGGCLPLSNSLILNFSELLVLLCHLVAICSHFQTSIWKWQFWKIKIVLIDGKARSTYEVLLGTGIAAIARSSLGGSGLAVQLVLGRRLQKWQCREECWSWCKMGEIIMRKRAKFNSSHNVKPSYSYA